MKKKQENRLVKKLKQTVFKTRRIKIGKFIQIVIFEEVIGLGMAYHTDIKELDIAFIIAYITIFFEND